MVGMDDEGEDWEYEEYEMLTESDPVTLQNVVSKPRGTAY